MAKAFDTVNHQKLVRTIKKLRKKLIVKIDVVQSTDLTMLTGVPQGTIQNLLLYIYI